MKLVDNRGLDVFNLSCTKILLKNHDIVKKKIDSQKNRQTLKCFYHKSLIGARD